MTWKFKSRWYLVDEFKVMRNTCITLQSPPEWERQALPLWADPVQSDISSTKPATWDTGSLTP